MKFVVDIDGTVLFTFINDEGEYVVDAVNTPLILFLNRKFEAGHEVIYHTARHWNLLLKTKEQLNFAGAYYTTVVMGKPVADFYIDDKAVQPSIFIKTEID